MNVNTLITWKSVSPSLVCCLLFNPVSRLSPRPLPFHNDEKCERGRGRPLDLAWRNQARGLREEFPLSGWSQQPGNLSPPPSLPPTQMKVFFFSFLKTSIFIAHSRAALSSVTQHWHGHFLPEIPHTSYRKNIMGCMCCTMSAYTHTHTNKEPVCMGGCHGEKQNNKSVS